MNWFLFAIIVILQILDLVSTLIALAIPGVSEVNKFMAWLMDKIGVIEALVLTKILICTVIATAIYFASSIYLTATLAVIIVGYSAVVINNFRNFRRLQ